jgi:hypothetical protein
MTEFLDEVPPAPGIDITAPHPARMYDFGLGGKNHFAADRAVSEKVLAAIPTIRTVARENRKFLGRAVRYLAAECGVRQFLDIGSGLPSTGNVHEIAQDAAPRARVVYVDNDPLVLVHARALLASSPEGRTGYIEADLRDPAAILEHEVTRDLIDFSQPVAIVLCAVLHFLDDDREAGAVLGTLKDALPAGGYLVASHSTSEHTPPAESDAALTAYRAPGTSFQPRDSDVFARLAFDGLDLVPPGVVLVSEWHPADEPPRPTAREVACYGGVARKSG